jgi:hypothetical protein
MNLTGVEAGTRQSLMPVCGAESTQTVAVGSVDFTVNLASLDRAAIGAQSTAAANSPARTRGALAYRLRARRASWVRRIPFLSVSVLGTLAEDRQSPAFVQACRSRPPTPLVIAGNPRSATQPPAIRPGRKSSSRLPGSP